MAACAVSFIEPLLPILYVIAQKKGYTESKVFDWIALVILKWEYLAKYCLKVIFPEFLAALLNQNQAWGTGCLSMIALTSAPPTHAPTTPANGREKRVRIA